MATFREPPTTLVEPVPIEDDFCTGLAMVEEAGPCARFVLFAVQTCYETGATIFVVKRKIILPIEAIVPGIEMTSAFLARRAIAVVTEKVRGLQH